MDVQKLLITVIVAQAVTIAALIGGGFYFFDRMNKADTMTAIAVVHARSASVAAMQARDASQEASCSVRFAHVGLDPEGCVH